MRDILDDKSLTVLTILVMDKLLAFEWGKSTLMYIQKYAKKMSIQINIIRDSQSAAHLSPNSLLIVYGNDPEWLNKILQELTPLHLRIILLDVSSADCHANVSHILINQAPLIENCLELLKTQGRNKTAFWGVQKNDNTDTVKADYFAQHISYDDVYQITDDIHHCFELFLKKIHNYDSVICANDHIAVYLMSQCRKFGIAIPQDLHIIGNGNTWIASHITPSLTTSSDNREALAAMILRFCTNMHSCPTIKTMDVFLNFGLIERESTGKQHSDAEEDNIFQFPYPTRSICNVDLDELCPDLLRINKLNEVLSSRTQTELQILNLLTLDKTYNDIAEEVFLSVDTVKYYVKKLYALLEISSRKELIALTDEYQICYF